MLLIGLLYLCKAESVPRVHPIHPIHLNCGIVYQQTSSIHCISEDTFKKHLKTTRQMMSAILFASLTQHKQDKSVTIYIHILHHIVNSYCVHVFIFICNKRHCLTYVCLSIVTNCVTSVEHNCVLINQSCSYDMKCIVIL